MFSIQRQTSEHVGKNDSINAKVSYPSRTIVHPKLETTEPGDSDEKEADAVANDVMSGRICRQISHGNSGGGMTVSSQMEGLLNSMHGGGQIMPDGLRNMMERGFSRDFSQVRLHTDSTAAEMSASIHAKAFTYGSDIYFNRGQYNPNTAEGQRLVAHELAHVAQSGGKIARDEVEDGDTGSNKHIEKIKYFFAKGNYDYDDLIEPLCALEEHDFYRLLCTNLYDFNQIAKSNPNFIMILANIHADSFIRLRFSDKEKFAQLFTTKNGEGPDFESFPELLDINTYHLIETDKDQLLGITSEKKQELTDNPYHDTRRMVENAVEKMDSDLALALLKKLNTYDFCDLLIKDTSSIHFFINYISDEEFVSLMRHHYRALIYLYKKENKIFNDIFYYKFEILNKELGKPNRFVFIRDVVEQLLKQKNKLIELCSVLQKDIKTKIHNNNSQFLSSVYEWFGNETMELEELYDIVNFVKKDLYSISADGNFEKNYVIFTTSFHVIDTTTKRLNIYIHNYINGLKQYETINYFVKTVCFAVLSAGVGTYVGTFVTTQTLTQSVIANAVISTATGGVLELTDEVITGNVNGKNLIQAGGIGTTGGFLRGIIEHTTKASGPFAKILADTLLGTLGTIVGDTARDKVPDMNTSEVHDDIIDAALYGYYASKIGGIKYDEKEKVYYIKTPQSGKEGERQQNLVIKMNNLLTKLRTEDSFSRYIND